MNWLETNIPAQDKSILGWIVVGAIIVALLWLAFGRGGPGD